MHCFPVGTAVKSARSMGLDGVELVLSVEEGFGVSISDAEAERCATPGDLIELVHGKLQITDQRTCIRQRGFYVLRRGLMSTLGLKRSDVTLDARLADLGVPLDARTVWVSLRDAVQARSWPELVRPPWLRVLLLTISLLTFAGICFASHWLLGLCGAGVVASISAKSTLGFRSHIPPKYSRVRDLIPFAVTSEGIAWNRDQIAALVQQLVIEQLDLKPGVYREDAHFVKDLGLS